MADIIATFRLIDNQDSLTLLPSIKEHLIESDESEEIKESIKEMLEELAESNNMQLVKWRFKRFWEK